MATDATGTPTAKGIPKFNTAVDAPTGKGANAQMDAIDTLLNSYINLPAGIATGETMVWNGAALARSSVTRLTTVRPQDLGQDGATTGQPMVWDGSKWAPGSLVLERRTASVDINTTITEKTLYDGANASAGITGWNIAGNVLGTDKMLRLSLAGDILHNNVNTDTATLKVVWGGTTLFQDSYNFNGFVNVSRVPFFISVYVANLGVTNSQHMWGWTELPALNNYVAPTTGIGDINNATFQPWHFGAASDPVKDTTAAQKLDVTITWSASSANNSWRRRYAVLELV